MTTSIVIPRNEYFDLMRRFPEFELSYEMICHKKVPDEYSLAMAIPIGRKVFIWFSYRVAEDVCYILDINKDKKIVRASTIPFHYENEDPTLAYGTILYGTIFETPQNPHSLSYILVEDIYYYKGLNLKMFVLREKYEIMAKFFGVITPFNVGKWRFRMPVMWKTNTNIQYEKIPYPVHHIQYRVYENTKPHLNVLSNKRPIIESLQNEDMTSFYEKDRVPFRAVYSKRQYNETAIFQVRADVQYDIYHLYMYGLNKCPVYYDVASIPNYKTSVFMNGIFRKIRENQNIDYIEESEDEEDFENIKMDKYVDLNKRVLMKCVFNRKSKKWTPLEIVGDKYCKIVHLKHLGEPL
jgi:hypothetical protein